MVSLYLPRLDSRRGRNNGSLIEPHLPAVRHGNTYTYTGQDWDENMGIYEFYSRGYDPVSGVWLQQDRYRGQITDPQSLLRYKYVDNDPIGKRDYYGYLDLLSPFTVSSEIYANQELFGRSETLSQQDARLAQETYMSTSALRRKLALQVREEICTEGRAGRLYWLQDQIDQIDLELKALAEKYGFAMEKSSENWRNIQTASQVWGWIPVVGAGYSLANFVTGSNAFTGYVYSGGERFGQLFAGVMNIFGSGLGVGAVSAAMPAIITNPVVMAATMNMNNTFLMGITAYGMLGVASETNRCLQSGCDFGTYVGLAAQAAINAMVGLASFGTYMADYSNLTRSQNYVLNPNWKDWEKYMDKRQWTEEDISRTLKSGTYNGYNKPNYLNPGNPSSLVTDRLTGKSLVIDNFTNDIIQLGGDPQTFKY